MTAIIEKDKDLVIDKKIISSWGFEPGQTVKIVLGKADAEIVPQKKSNHCAAF